MILALELVDQAQACPHRARPGLGQRHPLEQHTARDAEQIGDRAGLTVCQQHRVHTLLQARAVADEMQSPTRPLALPADGRIGQPDRRHQLATNQLCQHPGIDPVGLTGKRRQPFHLLRVGDLYFQPARSS